MIIPSIDLQAGRTVQLVGGERLEIDAGDPIPIAERFSVAGEIAVIDLDAAMGSGGNRALVEELVRRFTCRVGGGIRDYGAAAGWLDAGASSVIIGTAATPELLRRLPRERVIAALDARSGEVVVEGWKRGTGRGIIERVAELKDHVGGFLVTFVEREGRMGGTDMELARRVVEAAGKAKVTIAGGVAALAEIAKLDRMGADAQIGMALYSGRMDLADAISSPLRSDRPDGLWPTVVADDSGVALGLAWSDAESLREAVRLRRGVYCSRTRGLWIKGEGSGDVQDLIRIDLDCDRDALRFTVRQSGQGFCHLGTRTCWGDDGGLRSLSRRLFERRTKAPDGSYTRRLFDDPALLASKLKEEAGELAEARGDGVAEEAADLIYFALVAMARSGVEIAEVERVLDRRSRKLTRRPGDAKPAMKK
ncbi:MAG: phosphoribosyl-ATP diphosphatase [Proteobacteria bacterium]|nr:phosphoribosyl-ATP diphosphatase [Pseudomonadota bacterium]